MADLVYPLSINFYLKLKRSAKIVRFIGIVYCEHIMHTVYFWLYDPFFNAKKQCKTSGSVLEDGSRFLCFFFIEKKLTNSQIKFDQFTYLEYFRERENSWFKHILFQNSNIHGKTMLIFTHKHIGLERKHWFIYNIIYNFYNSYSQKYGKTILSCL